MKKMYLLLLSFVITFTLVGCDSNDDLKISPSPAPLAYSLNMYISSESGANLCKEMLPNTYEPGKCYEVLTHLYTHRLAPGSFDKVQPLEVFVDSQGEAAVRIHYLSVEKVVPEMAYYLSSPTLFGDNKEHSIISYWRLQDKPYCVVCYKVTVDGKEIQVLNKKDEGYMVEWMTNIP